MPKASSATLVVRQHQPWKILLLVVVLAGVVTAGGWGLFYYGQSTAGEDFVALQQEKKALQKKIAHILDENQELREQKAVLEHGGNIEKQAYDQVNTSLKTLQDEILELKEEVAFYRSIVAPKESSKGLRIQSFKLEENGQERGYRFKLVLTQVIKNNKITRGTVTMVVEGLQSDKPTELKLSEVTTARRSTLSFKFKYFQNLEGDVQLPDGFIPSRVKLSIASNRTNIDKTFDWPRESEDG